MTPLTTLLQRAGYPTIPVVVDFETYYDRQYSLSQCTVWEFIRSPNFEVLGAAFRYAERPARFLIGDDVRRGVDWILRHRQEVTVLVQNAHFDITILREHYGFHPPFILDLLWLSRHYHARESHSLAALAKAYGLDTKGDTAEFKGVHLSDVLQSRELQQRLSDYACRDADLTYELAVRLAPYFSRPEVELPLAQHTLNLYYSPFLCYNTRRGKRLLACMHGRKQRALQQANITESEVNSTAKLATRLRALGVNIPMKPGKKGDIPAFAKTDATFAELAQSENAEVRALVHARTSTKLWSPQCARLETLARLSELRGGPIPVYLRYYAAATGRWGGGEKTNLQNLAARNPDPLIRRLRTVLVPPAGYVYVIVDAAQIEARGVDWIAGQTDYLAYWRQGADIYRQLAADIYQKAPEDISKTERMAGKLGILGAGYGMGATRLYEYARTAFDLPLSITDCENIIESYRRTHHRVVRFWRTIETKIRFTIENRVPTYEGRLSMEMDPSGNNVLRLSLPSGRRLYYHDIHVTADGELRSPDYPHLWGGVFTENIVQAIARDILADAILAIEEAGFPVVLHVHDEVVMCVPQPYAERCMKKAIQIMSTAPSWAEGWPLGAEGRIAHQYGK